MHSKCMGFEKFRGRVLFCVKNFFSSVYLWPLLVVGHQLHVVAVVSRSVDQNEEMVNNERVEKTCLVPYMVIKYDIYMSLM